MKIDWIRKITSRKFWAAVISVVLCICVIFGVDEITQEQISALLMAIATLISYIFAEGFVDAKNTDKDKNNGDDDNGISKT